MSKLMTYKEQAGPEVLEGRQPRCHQQCAEDPLGLVQTVAGRASFKTDHKAMISIRDYIDKRGTVDGKRLLDDFSNDPFGWSPDTALHRGCHAHGRRN